MMIRTLLKKQMTEIFRSYFYDTKKNKKRSAGSTAAFIILYVFIMVVILGGMFTGMSIMMCAPFAAAGMSWMYFLIMGLTAAGLGTFGSVFNTYSGLYLSKDNDLLLSMPIPVRSILISRLSGVYLMGLMYSGVVILPAVIVYWVLVSISPLVVLGTLLLVVLVSLIVLLLSCILGWCVARISTKLKNKSFITVALSLIFLGLYYVVFYRIEDIIQNLVQNVVLYGEKVRHSAYPLYLFGKVGEGDIAAMLVYTVAVGLLCVLTYRVLSRSFIRIATTKAAASKAVYKEKKAHRRSVISAVLHKEFGRFTSSPNYMLNCGLGSVFILVIGGFAIVKGEMFRVLVCELFGSSSGTEILLVGGAVVICLAAAMNDMVVPSVSLEGKSIWILQSLPVKAWDVMRAKLLVQLLVTGIPVVISDICLVAAFGGDALQIVAVFLLTLLYTLFIALFGLLLGLKRVNLTWTNELAPIKQNLGVMISLFGGMAVAIVTGVVYVIAGWQIGASAYLYLAALVFAVLSVVLYRWLKKKGTAVFAEL